MFNCCHCNEGPGTDGRTVHRLKPLTKENTWACEYCLTTEELEQVKHDAEILIASIQATQHQKH